jgi:ATP-binding cassette subfamily A (ABC1) protein 3
MVVAFDVNTLMVDDCYGAVVLIFVLYGWAIIPFTYLTGFIFKGLE